MKLMRQVWLYSKRYKHIKTCSRRLASHLTLSSITGWLDFSTNQSEHASQIIHYTEVTRKHLTPEIQLHLITQNCDLWHIKRDNSPFSDPFWAFYWPGGQAVTRYLLDNCDVVRGKTVLDVGCGCGASSIAAVLGGANIVLANDIDTVATVAVQLNAHRNGCSVKTSSQNLIGSPCHQWDVIILGDMFYDSDFTGQLSDWFKHYVRNDTLVLIGDPGRLTFMNHPMKSQLTKIAEYELPDNCKIENNGLTSAAVWRLSIGLSGDTK